jgi:hypothetical protein
VRAEVSLDPNKPMAELKRPSTRWLICKSICLSWFFKRKRPSNEIQTSLNLLFKKKEHGLYAQDFAKIAQFPKADLSHAYLVRADFSVFLSILALNVCEENSFNAYAP